MLHIDNYPNSIGRCTNTVLASFRIYPDYPVLGGIDVLNHIKKHYQYKLWEDNIPKTLQTLIKNYPTKTFIIGLKGHTVAYHGDMDSNYCVFVDSAKESINKRRIEYVLEIV